ncbi:SpoIIE family protein phosphatase [Acanthopleuribacter pedis]|uniref:Response regulator n=1 Tax=Acanthopleuribacter pedis TaxID=442870 RepID=A0A8J7U416_9BACT|nr:SpoIIE family protein phosphatase [Acanthopleuribacter pedis]MBO1319349.1 response regulator [Acanthopleuribacter pedis]
MKKHTIICVDDEQSVLNVLSTQLRRRFGDAYNLEFVESGDEALELLEELEEDGFIPVMILCDQIMPNMSGDELLTAIHKEQPHIKKILLTGQASLESAINVINNADLYRYIVKPWEEEDLLLTIEKGIEAYFLVQDLHEKNRMLEKYSAELEQMVEERTAQLQERNTELESLDNIVRTINQRFNFENLLTTLLEQARVLFPRIDHAVFLHHNHDWDAFLPFLPTDKHGAGHKPPISHTALKTFFERGKAVKPKITLFAEPSRETTAAVAFPPVTSLLAAMVQHEGRVQGVLLLGVGEARAFDEDDVEKLARFRTHMTSALGKAQIMKALEQHNQQITSSLEYARVIQGKQLPKKDHFAERFPGALVFYQPKHLVSGDFYWIHHHGDRDYLAVVDCTGHGVPGALISMIGITLLNKIVTTEADLTPAQILSRLRSEFCRALTQGAEKPLRDDMELGLCMIDRRHQKIHFSGAKRPLYFIEGCGKGTITIYQGNRTSIGGRRNRRRAFSEQIIPYMEGDAFYLFTDGFPDQAGAEDYRKLGLKSFRALLEHIHGLSTEAQHAALEEALKQFQKRLPQRDDITVVGVRL